MTEASKDEENLFQQLKKVVLVKGEGSESPNYGDTVCVHYTGTLENGEVFDSSRDKGDPIAFKLAEGRLMHVWEDIIKRMLVGERCKVTCPPHLGYSLQSLPPNIPPHSTLIFDIELISCTEENVADSKNLEIRRKMIKLGTVPTPNDGSLITAYIRCDNKGDKIQDETVTFNLGSAYKHNVPLAVDIAIKKFKQGEISRLRFNKDLCEGLDANKLNMISDNVQYTVELTSFVQAKSSWEMTPEEKLLKSEEWKSVGTQLVKDCKWRLALRQYNRSRNLLGDDPLYTDQQLAIRRNLLLACHLNCALCRLKREQWIQAKDECDKAIWLDIINEKAYYRRAMANIGRSDHEDALTDLQKVLEINPDNKSAQSHLIETQNKLKKTQKNNKNVYNGMFQRFAQLDCQHQAIAEAQGFRGEEPIGHWSNDMASGMMSLQQEMEAFDEVMPTSSEQSYNKTKNGQKKYS